MRYLPLFFIFFLSACGNDAATGPCASSALLGTWASSSSSWTFEASCAVAYDNFGSCTGAGTYADAGTSLVATFNSATGTCAALSGITQSYAISGSTLTLTISGVGSFPYERQ